jgi:hypothetical protein
LKVNESGGFFCIRVQARRFIEQQMVIEAFRQVLISEFPGLDIRFIFDDSSFVAQMNPWRWRKRKDLDGD